MVSRDNNSVDPAKVSAILDLPVPTLITSIRSFCGLAFFYRKFVLWILCSYGSKYVFCLDTRGSSCFGDYEATPSAPLLALPDWSQMRLFVMLASQVLV